MYSSLLLLKQLLPQSPVFGKKSLITFSFRDTVANAKSVLSVLGACVKSGDEITLTCEGEDEEAALKALVTAIESGLGE